MKKYYLTNAIPYMNGSPHVGHAYEFVLSDSLARFHRLLGESVFLTIGADENALKNVQAAEALGIKPLELCSQNLRKFQELARLLNLEFSVWRRGSDEVKHWPGVRSVWQKVFQKGDIYKKEYQGLYCVGCEAFKTAKELVAGQCPEHLKKPELVTEENYFFRLSKYEKILRELIESKRLRIVPESRRREILTLIKNEGLADFSISRSQQRARGWGIPVPGDSTQIIYVWFDALIIYLTGIGFGYDEKLFKQWWPAQVHIIGKDIIRFHGLYWIGMLLSADIVLPKEIFAHGFITSGGQKMSKTVGNVIDPFDLIDEFGSEAVRYYFLREIPSYDDGDLTLRRFKEVYNADLANGLGNLVARLATLAEKNRLKLAGLQIETDHKLLTEVGLFLKDYRFNEAMEFLQSKLHGLDQRLDQEKPWKKSPDEAQKIIKEIITGSQTVTSLLEIAAVLAIFLPVTAVQITRHFQGKEKIKSNLFPRK